MLTDYQTIMEKALKKGPRRFAVAGAEGKEVLEASLRAREMNIMEPILIGSMTRILTIAAEIQLDLSGVEVSNAEDDADAAEKAARAVQEGRADALMKGNISTPVVLHTILEQRFGLRTGNLLSHVALLEIPNYHKLICITDSGMVIRPSLEQKKDILKNALGVMRKLGVDSPKVAILAANEKTSPDMPETGHAAVLAEMGSRGEFGPAVIEGPMALDVAFSAESAAIKKIPSQVAGNPDILLVPDISSGNIFAKGLVYLANAKIAGIVVGARMPIVLISRAEKAETWIRSIALANVMS